MLFVVLCPGTPGGSTGSGSGFNASQKTGKWLEVSSDRLGELGINDTFKRFRLSIRLFQVRLWTCRAFITELRIEHSLHAQFCTFPMWSKSGSSTVPALYP